MKSIPQLLYEYMLDLGFEHPKIHHIYIEDDIYIVLDIQNRELFTITSRVYNMLEKEQHDSAQI